MKQIIVDVTERLDVGKTAMKRLRKAGAIPGVVYGEKRTPKIFSVNARFFHKNVLGKRQSQLYKLESQNPELNGLVVLVKDMQFEALKDAVLHVDFYAITEGHRITVSIPVELIGESPAVKLGEAILNQSAYEIEVNCLPSEIPEMIQVDISGLIAGHMVHASDLVLPANVELVTDPETSIVGALVKREEEAAPAAAAAPAEGAAAAATAAPAAGGKS